MKTIIWKRLSILYKCCETEKIDISINNYRERKIGTFLRKQFGKINFYVIKRNYRGL